MTHHAMCLYGKLPAKAGKHAAQNIPLLIALCCFLWAGSALFGQVITSAKVVGTITDPSGAAIPHASVTLTNVGTNVDFKTTTNGAGNYTVIVPVGSYTMSVRATGFQTTKVSAFKLNVSQVARVDQKLQLGRVTQQVQVSAGAVALQTEATSVGTVIGSREAVQLPLNGRTFVQLAWLSPGVNMAEPSSLTNREGRGSLGQEVGMEANGARSSQNRFYFDGIQSEDMEAGTFAFPPSVEAIAQFKVDNSTYSAATGGAPGGQVNLIIKSGTNHLHGTLWEYNRDNEFSAVPGFTPPGPQYKTAKLIQNQFGANLGGPIVIPRIYNGKNKAFFFFNWESGRLIKGINGSQFFIPPTAWRTGDFSGTTTTVYDPETGLPFPGNKIPADRLASFATKYLSFLPQPNVTLPGANYFAPAASAPTNQNQYIARIDYHPDSRDTLSGSYMYDHDQSNGIPTFAWNQSDDFLTVQNVWLSDTHVFSPSIINQLYGGWNKLFSGGVFGTSNDPKLNIANIIGIAGVSNLPFNYGPPNFGVAGINLPNLGGGPDTRGAQIWQYSDNISIQKGQHFLHAGVDIMRRNFTFDEAFNPRGTFDFDGRSTTLNGAPPDDVNAFAAFMLGLATSASISPTPFATNMSNWWNDFYFQDDWKARPNLTLNIGLRYDLFTQPLQKGANTNFLMNGVFPGWVPSEQIFHDAPGHPNTPGVPAALTYPDYKDWGPRAGFAYQVPGVRALVVRGGYGIYWTPEIDNSFVTLTFNYPLIPTFSVTSTYNAPFDPTTVFSTFGSSAKSAPAATIVDPHNRATYTQEFNFMVEKELSWNTYLTVGYVGSMAHRLVGAYDSNRPIQPVVPGPGVPSVQSRRPLPLYGNLTNYKDYGASAYNSLQAKLRREVATGLDFIGAYTYAKSMSNTDSSSNGEGEFLNQTQNYLNLRPDWSISGFDVGQRLSVGAIYNLPFFAKAPNSLLGEIGGGWQLSTIISIQTGFPAGLSGVGDTTGTGVNSRVSVVPGQKPMLPRGKRTTGHWFNTAAFQQTPLGQFGNSARMNIYMPGARNVDASAVKSFHLAEFGTFQLRADFFNLFNHTNWGAPGVSLLNPQTFGVITKASIGPGFPNDPRILQFSGKLQF